MVFLLFKLLMFSKKNDSCLYIINTPDFQVRDTLIEKNKKTPQSFTSPAAFIIQIWRI